MFKELFALTERAPVMLLLTREDGKLRVNLTRKQDKNEKDGPISISILAAPDELDNELPLALAEGLAIKDVAAPSVADQVRSQVSSAGEKDDATPKATAKRKRAAKTKPPKAPKKAKPAPAKKKPTPTPKPAPAPKPKKPAKGTPLAPSPELRAVAGDGPFLHNDAMKAVWKYIKDHELQGKKNKRLINADDTFRALIGKATVDTKDLAAIVRKNLLDPAAPPPAPAAPVIDPTPVITPLLPHLSTSADPEPQPTEPQPPATVDADNASAASMKAATEPADPPPAKSAGALDLF